MSSKQYAIVFGDVDKYLEGIKIPPSQSIVVKPFGDQLKVLKEISKQDVMSQLVAIGKPVALFLMAFFPDLDAMKKAFDEDPNSLIIDDDDFDDDGQGNWGIRLYGIGGELYTVNADLDKLNDTFFAKTHNFPEDWEIAKAPLLLRTGEVKSISSGFSGMLNRRVLDVGVFRWLAEQKLDTDNIKHLLHLNMTNTFLVNEHVLKVDPNAPFTIYVKREDKTKRPRLQVVN